MSNEAPALATEPISGEAAVWHARAAGLVVAIFVLAKLPVLNLPYYWDEAVAYVLPSLWLADAGLDHAFPGRHFSGRFYGHPPLIYLTLASLYQVFGHAIWLTHTVAIGLGAACLYLTYRVGWLLGGSVVGGLAMSLLLLDPMFFAQAGMMHGDMIVAALGLATVLLYLQSRWAAMMCCAVLVVLGKETGIGIVAAISAYHLLFRRDRPNYIAETVAHASPAAVLAVFLGATWLATGRLVDNHYFNENALTTVSLANISETSWWLFVNQGRWILPCAIGGALLLVPKAFARREVALLVLLILPFWAAFSVLFFLPRYLLPAMPYLCIAAGLALAALGRRFGRGVPVAALAAVAMLFARDLPGNRDEPSNYEFNLGYVEVVNSQRALASWIEANHPDATISVAWPLNMNLELPALGYVTRRMSVVGPTEDAQLLGLSAPGDPRHSKLRDRIREEQRKIVRSFGEGNRVAEVFGPGSGSVGEALPHSSGTP